MITVSMQHSLCLLLFTWFLSTLSMEVYKNLLGLSERGGRGQPATLTTVSCLGLGRRPIHPYTQRATTLKNVHYNLLHSKKSYVLKKHAFSGHLYLPFPALGSSLVLRVSLGCLVNTLHLSFFRLRVERVPLTPGDSKSQSVWWFSEDT